MPALQKFLQVELRRRDWSVEDFARRAFLSTSRGYQIVNEGQDNVRQDTFERIAAALGWTAADLAARMGSGQNDLDAFDMEWLDLGRLLPLEQRSTFARMVRAAVNPSSDTGVNTPGAPINRRRRGQQPPLTVRHRALMLTKLAGTWAAIVSLFSRGYHPLPPPAAATA